MEFHELAAAFPLMEGDDYRQLVEDIRAHGLRDPITLYEDKILDGRNRHRACMDAGTDPRYEAFEGTEDEAAAFVWSKNAERRQLNSGQRALAWMELDTIAQKLRIEAKERQREAGREYGRGDSFAPAGAKLSEPSGKTEDQLAHLAGVGKGTMARAGVLKRKAQGGNQRAAELIDDVKTGKVLITSAYEEVRTGVPAKPAKPTAKTEHEPAPESADATVTTLPVWRQAHPASMLIANLGAFRREVERQGEITDAVLAAWWANIEWREWEAACSDVLWFREHCLPMLNYVFRRRNDTPPSVREHKRETTQRGKRA